MKEIAAGGMGSVFLARASGPAGFEKLVALKRIHAHMANDPKFVRMFLDEARLAARIQHPNVCNVIDFGEIDGSYYLTMPYLFGRPLNQVIATAAVRSDAPGAQLPVMAMRIVADACEGLHAAHELKDDTGEPLEVVHRDVSPQNLLVGYDGVVRVLDFGVASARHRLYETSTGEVKGKFAYCSPEHVAAQPVDRRADVWGLGVVLWEAATGHRLFMRDNVVSTIRAVVDLPIPRLRDVRPDMPEGLQEICDRALSRELSGRYPTAREMGKDLQRLLARRDDFIAAGEVADWMIALFPDAIAQAQALVDETRTSDIAVIPGTRSASATLEEDPGSPTRILDTRGDAPAESTATTEVARGPVRPRALAFVGLGAGLGALTLLGIGALSVSILGSDDAGRATRSAVAEAPEASAIPPTEPAPSPIEAAGSPAAVVPDRVATPRARTSVVPPLEIATLPAEGEDAETDRDSPPPAARTEEVDETTADPGTARPPRDVRATRSGPPGRLNIAAIGGWALVFFEGRQIGEAPGVVTLPPGNHTIYVQPFGQGQRLPRRVTIRSGETQRLTVTVR
ncbi:MAG: protein kinase [Sandaracinaceae bacterium]